VTSVFSNSIVRATAVGPAKTSSSEESKGGNNFVFIGGTLAADRGSEGCRGEARKIKGTLFYFSASKVKNIGELSD
jgi:hypothetical protein